MINFYLFDNTLYLVTYGSFVLFNKISGSYLKNYCAPISDYCFLNVKNLQKV
jgi:hypothetical protein